MDVLRKVWRESARYAIAFVVFFVCAAVMAQQWVPPEDPDPRQVRDEANTDIRTGRLSLAAEKYLWYYENALKYRPSLYGVRLSFALHDWRKLAEKYPPALQDMRLARDRAEDSVRSRNDAFDAYNDFAALNNVLKEDGRTIELFKWLDQNDRHLARDVYIVAQGALVANGEFELCEKYIVGQNSFNWIVEDHERTVARLSEKYKDEETSDLLESYEKFFVRRASYIIAILVNRDRALEAEEMSKRALNLLDDELHQIQISDALEGIPPERLH